MQKFLYCVCRILLGTFGAGAFAAAPGPQPGAERPVFLGQHIIYAHSFDILQADLFDGLRIWNAEGTTWANVERVHGRFDFDQFDKHVRGAKGLRLDLMYTLGQTPQWASSRPQESGEVGMGAAAEPKDLADWARYVRAVATRYKGKITAYEVMNEPRIPEAFKMVSPGFFSGSASMLAKMTIIAAAEIRNVDPAAKVVCPAMTGGKHGLKRLDVFLNTGAGKYCDVIGFHYYLSSFGLPELRELILETHRIKARHGLAKVPIWNTETGFLIAEAGYDLKPKESAGPASRQFQSMEAARLAAKILVLSHVLGVERTYWFAHDTSWMGSTVADKRTNRLNNFGEALKVLKQWLSGHYLRDCAESATAMECGAYDQHKQAGKVVWGKGKLPSTWTREGYSKVEFLDGNSRMLRDLDQSLPLPGHPDDVIFLR